MSGLVLGLVSPGRANANGLVTLAGSMVGSFGSQPPAHFSFLCPGAPSRPFFVLDLDFYSSLPFSPALHLLDRF